ncbi:MAG: energy-coupling factor transporter transmembrane protein EcfT [Oscillospiraceae bacterium]|nr:energy-coupling factor transporter transmembrane protein EcfT [Oscillospiraceae bacterium]
MNNPARKDTFAQYHPSVNLLFFALTISFAMFLSHPVCLGLSLICSLGYFIYLKGRKAFKTLAFFLPLIVITALINPLFSSRGDTVFLRLWGRPITLEATASGVFAACMLITGLMWFACFNVVMTSDKILCLFGRFLPALSLILSMSLSFVPRFLAQVKRISDAQKCLGRDGGGLAARVRQGVKTMSILITWALENAIDTADSMKARGYGLKGRTRFSIYRFERRDKIILIFLALCGAVMFTGVILGKLKFTFVPAISGAKFDFWQGGLFVLYLAMCAVPLLTNLLEELKWEKLSLSRASALPIPKVNEMS